MADKSPDAFRTISEVADWLGVQPHVLRFWESKFSQVKPVKRAGGRRYYRPNDMLLLGGIRKLLHEDGLTIKGAQKVLREQGMAHVAAMSQPLDDETAGIAQDAEAVESPIPEAPFTEAPAETAEVAQFNQAATEPEAEESEPQADEAPAVEAPEDVAAELAPQQEEQASLPGLQPESPEAESVVAPTAEPEPLPEIVSTDPEPAEALADENAQTPEYEDFSSAEHVIENVESENTPDIPLAEDESTDEPLGAGSDAIDPVFDAAQGDGVVNEDLPEPPGNHPAPEPDVVAEEAAPEPSEEVSAASAPRPNIVDAPDPDETSIEVAPAALSTAFQLQNPDPAVRASLTPLVAQLATLRDKMAAAAGR